MNVDLASGGETSTALNSLVTCLLIRRPFKKEESQASDRQRIINAIIHILHAFRPPAATAIPLRVAVALHSICLHCLCHSRTQNIQPNGVPIKSKFRLNASRFTW